jgi:hypothetical protein
MKTALQEVRDIQTRLSAQFPTDAAKLDRVQTEEQAQAFLRWHSKQQQAFQQKS